MIVRKLKGIVVIAIIFIVISFLVAFGLLKLDVLIGLVIGILLAKVNFIWKQLFDKSEYITEKIISIHEQKMEFKSEIINKQKYYRRGQDIVQFRSRYRGNIKNGYFANVTI